MLAPEPAEALAQKSLIWMELLRSTLVGEARAEVARRMEAMVNFILADSVE